MTEFVCALREVGVGDRAVVGGKGAGLGELMRAGVAVPEGFVVTVRAFEAMMRGVDPSGSLRREVEAVGGDPGEVARLSAEVRARIASAPLPNDFLERVAAAYRPLPADPGAGGGGAAVAVRSSAIGEDSAETSFAGLQDTYLWVRGLGDVAGRVRDCWASLYNAEAVGYRRRNNIGERDLAMAVVVQRMVQPRCAGVMFTCSPATGDRSVIAVEAAWGLGSALVSGDVTPDSFLISKVTGEIVRRSVAVKLRMHSAAPGGTGVAAGDVPGPLQGVACLSDPEIAALARLGRRVEEHYGAPQDIEWAITEGAGPGQGQTVLLQSRPETVWARRRGAGPVATARPSAVDHVFEQLGRVNTIAPPAPER
jgi:pyruvate, water dikinase